MKPDNSPQPSSELAQPVASTCPRCGKSLVCGIQNGESRCWCQNYPPVFVVPADGAAACYCESCLRDLAEQARAALNEAEES